MSDLISRAEIISTFTELGKTGRYGGMCEWVIEIVKQLPTAELCTNLAEVDTDCISRQAAIDYFVINVGFHDEDGYPIEDTDELRKIWTEYFDGIPSAEPKRGTWIDTGSNEEWYAREYECSECGGTMLGEANFCPNCGADMREVTT